MTLTERVMLAEHDISPDFEWAARDNKQIAWDIETSGLDWGSDVIATCQIHVPGKGTEIIRVGRKTPARLRELLMSEQVVKIFHHAAFDLRFMRYRWNVIPQRVTCTKVLSKILFPTAAPSEHSLKPILLRHLGVELDKSSQTSNWLAPKLDEQQLAYAARDVEFLIPLYEHLMDLARDKGLADIAERSFAYIPTRVETDLLGCGDVFSY